MTGSARVSRLYRYPVKGLSPEALLQAELSPGETLPADRRYAIENGPSRFDPSAPAYLPKAKFLMLMRNERLARLHTHYDDNTHVLTIRAEGAEAARGNLSTAEGRSVIEAFFGEYCRGELRGAPRVLSAPGHSFSDVAAKVVSLVNLASVAAIESIVGAPVDPLRFRANVHVAGWPAWSEFDWLGRELVVGAARLKIVKRIQRCAATNVDPDTGIRDLHIPDDLMKAVGHQDCGVYAQVLAGGVIRNGDAVTVV